MVNCKNTILSFIHTFEIPSEAVIKGTFILMLNFGINKIAIPSYFVRGKFVWNIIVGFDSPCCTLAITFKFSLME